MKKANLRIKIVAGQSALHMYFRTNMLLDTIGEIKRKSQTQDDHWSQSKMTSAWWGDLQRKMESEPPEPW